MRRSAEMVITLALVSLLPFASACSYVAEKSSFAPAPDSEPTAAAESEPDSSDYNFRLLISDDVNAIDQFASLNVTISRVGVHMGGESGKWFEPPLATVELDLVPLQEENAQEIWTGILDDGDYNKVFVHVTEIRGVLKTGETIDNIKLPSDKLHINTHFSIPEDAPVNFVFDLTVVAAGNEKSGIKYILKPVVSESGPKQKFNKITPPENGAGS